MYCQPSEEREIAAEERTNVEGMLYAPVILESSHSGETLYTESCS